MNSKIILSLLASASLLGGCTIHHVRTQGTVRASGTATVQTQAPTYVTVAEAPPPLKPAVTVRPQARANAAVWIEGHWSWQGGWVWVDGRWDTPPQAGWVWEPPVAVAVEGGGYQYHRGYWRRPNDAPPPIYRTEGTIRVHVRTANEPERVSRVVVRAGERPTSRVVVRPAAPQGRSSTVVVTGSATATTRPSTAPANRGNATVTVRGSDNRATPATPATPAARGRANVTVRGSASGTTRATPATPATPATRGGATATTTVRPATTARGNSATAMTTVRPSATARGNSATAMTTVRPATTARGNSATAMTAVRPAATPAGTTARANTGVRVRTPGGASTGAAPTVTGRSCRVQVAALPRNGVLVIRGNGLASATGVAIGSERVPMLDKRDDRVRARVQGRNNGGSVHVYFGDDRVSCGNVRITGR